MSGRLNFRRRRSATGSAGLKDSFIEQGALLWVGPTGGVLDRLAANYVGHDVNIPVTGWYTFVLDGSRDPEDGSITIVITDTGLGTAPDAVEVGVPFLMEFPQPGGRTMATFTANDGDQLSIDTKVPDSVNRGPSFALYGPDGARLREWLPEHGVIQVDPLAADGTYTLTFDPHIRVETLTFEVIITKD